MFSFFHILKHVDSEKAKEMTLFILYLAEKSMYIKMNKGGIFTDIDIFSSD